LEFCQSLFCFEATLKYGMVASVNAARVYDVVRPGLKKLTLLNKQETDDAIFALQSCAGEPARQLAAKTFFLAQVGARLSRGFFADQSFDSHALTLRACIPYTREKYESQTFF
jgi:hypothetical protein